MAKVEATSSPPKPPPALAQAESILELARRGDERVLPQLRKLLDASPHIAEHFGGIARIAEQSLINRIAGDDLRLRESLVIKVQHMRAELAGVEASPVDRLLVDRLVISWLAAYEAELRDSLTGDDRVRLAEFRLKRVDAAHRRVLSAAKTLATVRRLVGGLRVDIHHHDAQTAADLKQPAREQLREALAAGVDTDRKLTEVTS